MSDKIKNRAIVHIGYGEEFIIPLDKAALFLNLFEEAEKYEKNYEEVENGKNGYVEYISPMLAPPGIKVTLISDTNYHVAKLRGAKPEDK